MPARGSHLIMPDHFSPDAMGCVWFTSDGRVLYLVSPAPVVVVVAVVVVVVVVAAAAADMVVVKHGATR